MVTTLTPANQQFVDNINQITGNINRDALELSSGVTMRTVSDKPDQVSQLLQARAALSATQQISTNLSQIKGESDAGEQALENAVQLFDQVQTIGATGASDTQTADSRATLAAQLQSIEQQMVGLANTSFQGRFLFSGDSDQVAAYTYDPAQANPVSSYQGAAATRQALHPNGTTFPTSLTAQQIFDSADPSTNVFATLTNLVTAFQNNDIPAIQTLNGGLSKIGDYLNQQLAFYGQVQDNVSSATDFAQNQQVQLQTEISTLQDTDSTAAILDLTQSQTTESAALNAEARIPRTTLFDFLA